MPEKAGQQQPCDARAMELAAWADSLGRQSAGAGRLAPASADASHRRYFRHSSWPGVLADMPPSENPEAFVRVSARLKDCGLHVPVVQAMDPDRGFFWLTDLGNSPYLYSDHDKGELYRDALTALLRMQGCVDCDGLPHYDRQLLLEEMHLFRDWFLRDWLGSSLDGDSLGRLETAFALLCEAALAQPRLFVHRDYHSRNLMHCPESNPGVLDFQDAALGPYSYDLVSLLKDCYVRLDEGLRDSIMQSYVTEAAARKIVQVEPRQFRRDLDLMGVQRHLKATGIFARLHLRDGKSSYLGEIPRTLSYITELQGLYPELDWLAGWLRLEIAPRLEARLAAP